APPVPGTRAECKIRYKAQPAACTLYPRGDAGVQVELDEALRGVTPGQGAVFYDGDLCLGGGIIV
ncbi:MAG: tRNA 2-thiouridine(34) synthase MnmA, partial [Caldilineaceae bacterium]|nr:tRNA 2-thiouridine(34) synthase MnmA [Caldilineaceae bacterium]